MDVRERELTANMPPLEVANLVKEFTLDVSMGWLYAAMPVGFVLLALRYALELRAAEGRLAAKAAG